MKQIDLIDNRMKERNIHRLSAKVLIAVTDFERLEKLRESLQGEDCSLSVALSSLKYFRVPFCSEYIRSGEECNPVALFGKYHYLLQVLSKCPQELLDNIYEKTCMSEALIKFLVQSLALKIDLLSSAHALSMGSLDITSKRGIEYWWTE